MNLYNSANYLSAESHRVIGEFLGVNSPITGPILEGSRGQISYLSYPDLATTSVGELGDDAACRSDPTFTRASPGLAVAEQLPQINHYHHYYYYDGNNSKSFFREG